MCDTTIICTGQHDGGGSTGLDEIVGGAVVATGKGIYGLASLGAEILIRAGRWFSGKPMVSAATWGRPYRFTRAVRAAARTLLTAVALAGWLHPVITGSVLAVLAAVTTWLILRRRRAAAVLALAAVGPGALRTQLERGAAVPIRAELVTGPPIAAPVAEVQPAITMGGVAAHAKTLLGGRRR